MLYTTTGQKSNSTVYVNHTLITSPCFIFLPLITTWNSLIHVLSYLFIICLIPTRISFPWEQGSRKSDSEMGKSLDGQINEYVHIMMDKTRALLSKKIKILVGRWSMSLAMTQSSRIWSTIQSITKYNENTVPRRQEMHAGKTFDLRKGFMEESGISI